jgi:hypothetical protein
VQWPSGNSEAIRTRLGFSLLVVVRPDVPLPICCERFSFSVCSLSRDGLSGVLGDIELCSIVDYSRIFPIRTIY